MKKKDEEEKDRYAGHEARAGIYSTAPGPVRGIWSENLTYTSRFFSVRRLLNRELGPAILVPLQRGPACYLRLRGVTQPLA